ncbi:MAG TPA: hypothetical protein ACN46V_06510, partial [Prochlorococcus sp.]
PGACEEVLSAFCHLPKGRNNNYVLETARPRCQQKIHRMLRYIIADLVNTPVLNGLTNQKTAKSKNSSHIHHQKILMRQKPPTEK